MTSLKDHAPAGSAFDWGALRSASPYITPLRAYFRYETFGFEHIPATPHLLVANHNGGKLPLDMFLFGDAWHRHFNFERHLFVLMHDLLFKHSKWMAQQFGQIGGVPAGSDNMSRLFASGHPVLVLPGGDHETFRPYSERHRIDFSNRTGFAREAIRHHVPVIPVVTIGSHEMFFILTRGERFARAVNLKKWFRATSFPLVLGFPFGLYLGPIPSPFPLPTKVITKVLPPIHLWEEEHDHRAFSADESSDRTAMSEAARVVTHRMQQAMDEMAKARRYPIIG